MSAVDDYRKHEPHYEGVPTGWMAAMPKKLADDAINELEAEVARLKVWYDDEQGKSRDEYDRAEKLEVLVRELVDRKEDAVHYAAQCRKHQREAEAKNERLRAELAKYHRVQAAYEMAHEIEAGR
jgi:hypothetical protein